METHLVATARQLAKDFLGFINKAVSPFHVTNEAKNLLTNSGFQELSEQENWNLQSGKAEIFLSIKERERDHY